MIEILKLSFDRTDKTFKIHNININNMYQSIMIEMLSPKRSSILVLRLEGKSSQKFIVSSLLMYSLYSIEETLTLTMAYLTSFMYLKVLHLA